MRRLSVVCLAVLFVLVAKADAQIKIVPQEGSENPVMVGQIVVFGIEGLSDPKSAKAIVFPRTGCIIPVLIGQMGQDNWSEWGDAPQIFFTGAAPVDYLVGVIEGSAPNFNWAEHIVEVRGEPPPPPSELQVTPEEGFESSGPVGGPFAPRLKRYSLSAGDKQIVWKASAGASWVGLLNTEGTLAPNESAVVDVLIAPDAESLKAGTHATAVTFANVETGWRTIRNVSLTVDENPNPIPDELFVLVVYETDDLDEMLSTQVEILTSKEVRDYLNESCAEENGQPTYRFLDNDADVSNMTQDWQTVFDRAKNKEGPWIIIANGPDAFHEGPLPQTIEEMMTLLRQYGGE